jgi:beta-glucosidase/6-phospho-beta-glucosidase/beta-galactosidase
MGWELYPAGISIVLEDLKSYGKPIYITENGLADCEDKYRGWYIKEVLKNVLNSIESGVDVRGYFHWSLMDNFEWDKGFWPKFGLIDVDRKTMKRNIRSSAFIYRDIIERGFR